MLMILFMEEEMDEESQRTEKEVSEIEKAMGLLENSGYAVVSPLSLAAKPYIRELSDVLEAAGFRLDEAKVERNEDCKQTGRILLAVYSFNTLEKI
jgi:hypothetical protein